MSFSTRRIAAGFTLDDVSREFRVSPNAVLDWERGKAPVPDHIGRSLDLMRHIADHAPAPNAGGAPPVPSGEPHRAGREPPVAAAAGPVKSKGLIKSKQRVADHGEVFTPPWLVEKMLDLVRGETERIESRFLEPACGSGNFLVPILRRKLATVETKYGKSPFDRKLYALQALACCYGIELLADNIAECRANMLEVFADYLGVGESDDFYRAASHVLSLNLVHGDAMAMKAVPEDGEEPGPIMIVEWSYLGKAGKFNRRDFRLDKLTDASGFNARWAAPETEREVSLFGEPRPAFHHRGRDPIFVPVGDHPPMTVRELAALDREAASG